MKRLITLVTTAAMIAACGATAIAADKAKNEPDVFVDGSKIVFEDQNAVIVDDITLVPIRSVFSAMGCTVEWNGKTETATVTSGTGVRDVVITIGSKTMKIRTFKDMMNRETRNYELEVPAQLINDRTMIPLRAIAEAFGSTVEWNEDDYTINITSGTPIMLEGYEPPAETPEEKKVTVSLSTDKTGKLEAGEEFTVYVDVDNFPTDRYLEHLTATFAYDKSKVEYVKGTGTLIGNEDKEIGAFVFAEAPEHEAGCKVIALTIEEDAARSSAGHVYKATFRSITGEPCEIALNNDYSAVRGYNTSVGFRKYKTTDSVAYDGSDLLLRSAAIDVGNE